MSFPLRRSLHAPSGARALLVPVLLLALGMSGGCATRTPAADPTPPPEDPTIVDSAPVEPVVVPVPPPVAAPVVDPLLVRAAVAIEERQQRLATLAKGPNAVPAAERGYYLDVLYADLRTRFAGTAQVVQRADQLRIVLPPEITFEVASAKLSAAADERLKRLLEPLRDYTSLLISVHGHTDSTGPAEVNRQLSAQRALTVARRLQALGLPPRNLRAIGHGADQPRADNDTVEGRQANRRVELELDVIVRGDD